MQAQQIATKMETNKQTRVHWKPEERELVRLRYVELAKEQGKDNESLTMSWVRSHLGAASQILDPGRQRSSMLMVEACEICEWLQVQPELQRRYHLGVHGYLTLKEIQEKLDSSAEAHAALSEQRAYADEWGVSVFEDAIAYRGSRFRQQIQKEFEPKQVVPTKPARRSVMVVGVHNKHRDEIERSNPDFDITWIENDLPLSDVKRKVNGMDVAVCTFATGGNVLRIIKSTAKRAFVSGGPAGITTALKQLRILDK